MNIQQRTLAALCFVIGTFSWSAAQALPIDRQLTIQPIQICNDDGSNCANAAQQLFASVGDKIWAQAGIDLNFLPFMTINSTALNTLNFDTEFGAPAAGNTIRMLFVNSITHCGGAGAGIFGCGYIDANGVAIADNVFSFNGGIGRLDTIAHELGHNLGLGHSNFGAGGAENLMSSGAVRNIPSSIDDVYPNGAQTDQLTQAQIDEARASGFLATIAVVPLPGTLSLAAFALLAMCITRRRSA
jgi:hypothetical protein